VATNFAAAPLGYCKGTRPWLGSYGAEPCGGPGRSAQPNRLLVRSASNAYFAQTLSVISIPDADSRVRDAVTEVWEDYLQYEESLEGLIRDRKRPKVSAALEGLANEQVWQEVQRRKGGLPTPTSGI